MGNRTRPPMLVVAAAVLAAEAVALLVYTILNVVAIATGNSYQVSNSVALVVMQLLMLGGLLWLASGVLKLQPWTRTPSVMVQLLIGVVGVILLQAHQYAWGVPVLILALAGLAGLLTPASLKALARPEPEAEASPAKAGPAKSNPAQSSETKSAASGSRRSGNPAKRGASGKTTKTTRPAGKSASRR